MWADTLLIVGISVFTALLGEGICPTLNFMLDSDWKYCFPLL